MLYYLYSLGGINIFHYITFRGIVAFFISFIFTIIAMPFFIRWASNRSATQPIYELAPENHKKKSKTPTMGGVVFVTGALIGILLTAKLHNFYIMVTLLTILIFSGIGMVDDYGKIKGGKNHDGLSPRAKFILQWGGGILIGLILYFHGFNTALYIPFYKYPVLDLGILAPLFWGFVIVGFSNAVNLTDGLDGLATVPSIFALFSLAILLYVSGNAVFSKYLFFPFEKGVGEVVIVALAFIGSLLGFLWYNANPAEVFMGDSGSLTLGAIIGLFGIFTKSEILLGLIGFIFVMETMSVMIQVGSYKTRKKRVFRMAPIHHHFEIVGWKENKITIRFWILALMANILALLTLKLR
jgi:phospho-N-acetylmuramoyl-pentapeptide-transferase